MAPPTGGVFQRCAQSPFLASCVRKPTKSDNTSDRLNSRSRSTKPTKPDGLTLFHVKFHLGESKEEKSKFFDFGSKSRSNFWQDLKPNNTLWQHMRYLIGLYFYHSLISHHSRPVSIKVIFPARMAFSLAEAHLKVLCCPESSWEAIGFPHCFTGLLLKQLNIFKLVHIVAIYAKVNLEQKYLQNLAGDHKRCYSI